MRRRCFSTISIPRLPKARQMSSGKIRVPSPPELLLGALVAGGVAFLCGVPVAPSSDSYGVLVALSNDTYGVGVAGLAWPGWRRPSAARWRS